MASEPGSRAASSTPLLVITCGLPGAGKSVVARMLAQALPAQLLRTDVVRRELFPVRQYTPEEIRQVYQELLRRAEALLREGQSVVLDGTFSREEWREAARALAERVGARFALVEVTSPEEQVRQRLAARRGDVSEADFAVYRELRRRFQPIREPHLVVYNAGSLAQLAWQVQEVAGRLRG